jgi:hypothetical protein
MTLRTSTSHRTAPAALATALALGLGVFAGGAASAGAGQASAHPTHAVTAAAGPQSAAAAELSRAMRTLWAQHMEWTWSTVVAFAEGSPELTASLNRLLKNQADIGNAVGAYYGKAAGKRVTKLLTTHINQAVPVLTAAKAGDKKALTRALNAWYANARQIADFIAGANPNLPRRDLRRMMKTHITQTTAYAAAVLTGRYAKAIADYDKAEKHMLMLADALSQGIVAQFPDRF